MQILVPLIAIRGRGAASAMAHRYTVDKREAFDDGWHESLANEAGADSQLATQVRFELAKSALTHNQSPDMYFTQGLNPYRGCEHGCIYCYARPTHSYLGLSPGLDFETKIIAKSNLADVLARELQAKRYVSSAVAIGTVTDAYQPVERELCITRRVLEVFSKCHHPLSIITKGSGVERDIDLLAPMAEQCLATVVVTITTLDVLLARHLEPRAAAPHRRLRTIRTLVDAGIPVGVSVGPQIPFLNDDMEQVLEAAAVAGATSAFSPYCACLGS
jgi:DNA repair photolyase